MIGDESFRADENSSLVSVVLAIVAAIPSGMVSTYGDIARAAGISHDPRRIGWIVSAGGRGRCLPFHRVVNRQGMLSGKHAFGDPDRMRRLLIAEGVRFVDHDRVDLDAHRWPIDYEWPPPTK
ncbi:MGMT family protein [soil metagenome]